MNTPTTNETGDTFPGFSSFLGFTDKPCNGKRCARVCMDCPDKTQADTWAKAHGYSVTHTYCPACYYKRMNQLTGDHSDDE